MSVSGMETRQDEIAKRYGGVLFDLAQESKSFSSILKEVFHLSESVKDLGPQWGRVVRPVVSLQTQLQVIDKMGKVLKVSSLIKRFLNVLCHNRRLQSLESILNDFKKRSELAEGIIEGVLDTACELTQKQMDDLKKSLKKQLGKEVSLQQHVKEELLAGVVLKLGSLMIDTSLRSKLRKIHYGMKG